MTDDLHQAANAGVIRGAPEGVLLVGKSPIKIFGNVKDDSP
jgi:hypothetical protein